MRVAQTPTEAPPEDVLEAEEVQERVTDAPTPEQATETETQEATAPPEAATEIVTEAEEAEEAPTLAPTSSKRPKSRPRQPVRTAEPAEEAPAETVAEAPAEAPAETPAEPETDTQAVDDAVAAAIAAEAASSAPSESTSSAPAGSLAANGPPMTAGETDALRVAVERCWNVGALSTEAQRTTISVNVTVGQDKKPVSASITLAGTNGSDAATRQAFEAARRAILRCGAQGFPLPDDKYETWRELELIFDKGRVGL